MPVPESGADPAVALYQGRAGRDYHEGKRALPEEAVAWVWRLRAEKFQPWIGAQDVVFELGVGSGWNLARVRCGRRLGSDPATFLAERVRALGIEFHADPREVADAVADVAICHQTLEHLVEPAAALRELRRILKPGGRLILHVPWEVERRYKRYRPDDRNHHLYHWNVQNLGNLASVLGWQLEVVRLRRYGWDRFAAHWAVRLRLGEAGFRLLRRVCIGLNPLREVELVARRPAALAPTPAPAGR